MNTPAIGGTGKGASGAATIFGDNSRVNSGASPWLVIVGVLAGVALLGGILWSITKKK